MLYRDMYNKHLTVQLEDIAQKKIKLPKIGILLVETDNTDVARYVAAILGWEHRGWIRRNRDLEAMCVDLVKLRYDLVRKREGAIFACTRLPKTGLFSERNLVNRAEVVVNVKGEHIDIEKLRGVPLECQEHQQYIDVHTPKLQEYLRLVTAIDKAPIGVCLEMRDNILSTWLSINIKPL